MRRPLKTHQLPPSFDLDTVSDLRLLADERREIDARLCRRTLAWLDENQAWGIHKL